MSAPVRALRGGIAQWQQGQSAEDLDAQADRKLYEAKQAGRNRVVG